ncbi:DUF2975 domain-containing protein [Pedobacter jejuensis]|uniref:DUF2975 domain-containing protein n=1 Tax=Pedobacter jejuensis TaxID=1268550 RepID=A0A3N0C0H0_9SPHI|nr:DUF2975 domain-containing protein [Pedobacter jejuensis]RNL55695.1 DUF2975 domain-containing protein [Pedobacter jejuensis]
MKTQSQIKLIKIGYILILTLGFLISMINGGIQSFKDGYNSLGPSKMNFFQGCLVLVISFFAIRIFLYLYRFMNSVELDEVFNVANIRRLYLMGWYCISVPFLLFLFNCSNLNELGFRTISNVDFEFWLLILGITLLTISFVFKKGIELKQENDLTI